MHAIRWTFVRYLARFQLTWHVARSLGDSRASCTTACTTLLAVTSRGDVNSCTACTVKESRSSRYSWFAAALSISCNLCLHTRLPSALWLLITVHYTNTLIYLLTHFGYVVLQTDCMYTAFTYSFHSTTVCRQTLCIMDPEPAIATTTPCQVTVF